MVYNSLENLLREHLDYSDRETLQAVSEAQNQDQLLSALTSRLYDMIVEKANKIDYSTIAKSKGDITKIEKYETIMECISIMTNIVKQYNQPTTPLDIINTSLDNLRKRTYEFKKAFVINSPLLIMIYNNIAMAIVNSVSFMIAVCIEYIKNPASTSFQLALDTVAYNKAKDNLLFVSLTMFNTACKSGEMDNVIKGCMNGTIKKESTNIGVKQDNPFLSDEEIMNPDTEVILDSDKNKENEAVNEGLFDFVGYKISSVLFAIAKLIIPCLRNIVYYFFSTKQKISDYYDNLATLVEANALQLQYDNTIDPDKKKMIFDRQMRTVEKYRKRANWFSLDNSSSSKTVVGMVNKEDKSIKVANLGYSPDSAFDPMTSSIF